MAVELEDGVVVRQKVSSTNYLDAFTGNNFNAAEYQMDDWRFPKAQVPGSSPGCGTIL